MKYVFGEAPAILHQNLRGKGMLGAGRGLVSFPRGRWMRFWRGRERKPQGGENAFYIKNFEKCKNPLDKWESLRYNLIVSVH